ncbi:hypothetical protein DBT_2238 [Dissulfuribacter thermophilus]|uniref:Uncharacterized protein n=1 Tax=Dissulfuribacter thermophilus TaxID=1156395 RepID=A0A1B9F3G8_9BACT|nr:hypothetical protein DBT_2238 [Dissulfuribacter thermophilus]
MLKRSCPAQDINKCFLINELEYGVDQTQKKFSQIIRFSLRLQNFLNSEKEPPKAVMIATIVMARKDVCP